MRRRAELVDETRQRITDAAIRLHTTVGPSKTSISTIADEAGVTRLTVYRHFANADELFEACRGHWRVQHPRPDTTAWRAIPHLEDRARRAFTELYGWYRQNGADLYPIFRDAEWMPRSSQETARAEARATVEDLVADHDTRARGRLLRAAAGHLTGYWSWRSLAIEQGLNDVEAVDLAVGILMGAARKTATKPA